MDLTHREGTDGAVAVAAVAVIVAISLAAALRRRVLRGVRIIGPRREPEEMPALDSVAGAPPAR